MGTGYTRNDSTNNIANGNVINASDLDGEFDAIQTAFSTSGHTHDGTAAEGGAISIVGPAQEFRADGSAWYPKTDATYDLGKAAASFDVAYVESINLAGTAITASASELNKLDGVTASTTELNKLDGVTASTTEINYIDGVTSNIQTQLNNKQAADSNIVSDANYVRTDQNFTNADHTKLNSIETSATADQTASEIRALVESATDSNVFTDADHTKLNGIEASATADQTKADIEGLGIDVPATNITGTIPAARLSTATTQAESDDSTKIATTAYVVDKITTLIGGAPSTLNDLNELAAAINDDANYNSTLTTALATKLPLAGGTMTGDVLYGDNVKAKFGASSDLQIYHDGNNSLIKENNTSGSLRILGTNLSLESTAQAYFLEGIAGGAVSVYHNGSAKLATTSTGASVTGSLAVSDAATTRTNLDVDQAGSALAFAIALG